jgi:ribosomal-protein-alanine N-acetyltransferase
MSLLNINFEVKKAKYKDIYEHLVKCSPLFLPPLSSYVDIEKYAEKILLHSYTFEAWSSSVLVGLIAAYLNQISKENAFITNVSILPEYQRRGISRLLMKITVQKAQEIGFKKLSLCVNSSNSAALNLYKNFDFRIVSIDSNIIKMEKEI